MKVTPAAGDVHPYVALEHLAQGRPALLGWSSAGSATSAKTVFYTGDILFGKLRPNLRKAAVAPFDGVCSTDILPLFGKDGLDSPYLLHLAQWSRLQWHAIATSSGTKMPRTSWKQLGEFTFLLPPLSEQRKIAAILSSVDDAIEKTQAVIDQAKIVKRGLMQELFTRGLPGRHSRFQRTEVGEFPRGWMFVPLGQVVDVRLSGVDKKIIPGEIYVRLCNYTDVYNHRVVGADMDYMEATVTQREIDNFKLEVGDVVITKDSETPHDIGVPALVREEVGDLICGYHLAILRPSGSFLNGEFLHYALSTNIVKQQFRTCANGITRFGLRGRDIEHVRIPLPPIIEQRMIAVTCSSVDDIVEKNQAIMDRLQVVKSGLMPALLTGEVRVTPDTEAA